MAQASGSTDTHFAAAYAKMMADRSIQHSLPDIVVPMPPAWLKAIIEAVRSAWPVLRILVWIALAAAALALLWMLARRLWGLRWPFGARPSQSSDDPEAWQPDAGLARALLREADALAAAGRYGDAARLVLHRSIEDIERHRPALVRPATTSRDLTTLGALPDAARGAFAAIAAVVERSLFAEQGADHQAWDAARTAYATFARVDQW